jgi:hypothetical protein
VFGKSELSFLYHIHEFYARNGSSGGMHFPETAHSPSDTLDMPVVLFNYIV